MLFGGFSLVYIRMMYVFLTTAAAARFCPVANVQTAFAATVIDLL